MVHLAVTQGGYINTRMELLVMRMMPRREVERWKVGERRRRVVRVRSDQALVLVVPSKHLGRCQIPPLHLEVTTILRLQILHLETDLKRGYYR